MREGAVLGIRLLGAFEVRIGDTPLPLDSARTGSLLAFLLLHRDAPQPRQRIAFALWPDSTESQARTNLRHLLHTLRRTLAEPERYLEITPRTLRWRPDAPWWLDVAAFDQATTRAEGAPDGSADAVTALREAVELYRDDLLPGSYDEWLDSERQRLRGRFLTALHRLATLLGGSDGSAEAIGYTERLLRHDPLAEDGYLLLMRLYDARGDRTRALRAYHACAAALERELGTQPSAPVRRLYEKLRSTVPAAGSVPAPSVVEPSVAPSSTVEPARAAGPPLIGRAAERTELTRVWRAATAGDARLVLVTGEAGIGKTRLLEEFRRWCGHRGAVTATAGAYAAEGTLAYGLVVSWLRGDALAGRLRGLPPEQLTELARLLPELLTERPDLPRPRPLPESELRQRLFDAVAQAILGPGAPVLLVADDLHWSDRESLRLLHYVLRVRSPARLLVAASARREDLTDRHPLTELVAALEVAGRVTELPLSRFSPAETAELAGRLSGQDLDDTARDRLYRDTEGNPLFVVEALRAGQLSPRVQAVIEAQLAQLTEPALGLLRVAATIGRDFTVDVLAEAAGIGGAGLDEDILIQGLDELWRRRLVREHGVEAYDFSHGRIRDVVYGLIQPAQRRQLHRRVAEALRQRYTGDPGPGSGRLSVQLAVHFERAGAIDSAVEWYARAAEAAQRLYAHTEALRLLDHALDLLRTLPETSQRDAGELRLLTAVAAPMSVLEGFASARLAAVRERALSLSGRLGVPLSPPLLRGFAMASLSRGDFTEASRLGVELRSLGAGPEAVEAEYVLGIAEFWQGHFAAARDHFTAAVTRYRPADRDAHLIRYGLDPRVVCLSRLANTWWFLGDHAAAVRARDEALTLADEIGHPPTRSTALVFAALLGLELRDVAGIREYTTALLASEGSHFARVTDLTGELLAGYLDVLDGSGEPALTRIRRSVDAADDPDPAPGARAMLLRILLAASAAAVDVAAGDPKTGLAVADLLLSGGRGVTTWESEARRVRAELLAASGAAPDRVAAELDAALAVARSQGARLFELRALTSMARLGSGDTRDLLAGLVAELDGARGTPDWSDAVASLDAAPDVTPDVTPAAKRFVERSRNASSPTL
jgi:DNA-binding SARP family transcriptional activator